jgi:succinate-acetate transporter protein
MTDSKPTLGPGEARTRKRNRTQMIYLGIAAVVGGVIGLLTGIFDQGDGNLFGGNWEELKLPPLLALGIVALLLAGFLFLPLYGFRMIDDYKREQNLIAFTGGCLAVIAGFPVWAVLHAGGFAPPPHAFGVFGLAYVAMLGSFLFARWRL